MFKSITAKSITAIAIFALGTGLAIFLTSLAPEAKAQSETNAALPLPPAKRDRLTGAACSALGWPNYEQSCLFDLNRTADQTRAVRVIKFR